MSWKQLAIGCWVLVSGWGLGGYAAVAEVPQALYEEGLRALESQRILQAEQLFQRCLELDTTFYDAYVSLARLHFSRNSLDRADSLLATAMRQQPQRPEAPFECSKLLSRQGRLEEAYAQLKKVAELEPRTAAAYMGIGYLRMAPNQMMDLREAGEAFAKVHEFEPQNHEALFNLGQVCLYQGNGDAAIAAFRDLLAQRPENLSAHYQLGMALYLKGGYSEAAAELRRAVELAPRWLTARWALYLAYKHLGGYPADLPDSCRMELATQPALGEVRVRFVEVAAATRVDRLDLGRGSAWADCDGDGDLDLFTMGHFAGNALYRNDGGVFTDQTEEAGVGEQAGMGCTFADYDNDGDPDLYIARNGWYGKAPNTLFQNDGRGHFIEVSAQAALPQRWPGRFRGYRRGCRHPAGPQRRQCLRRL
ncbi:MAG: VCBS repeat-containing protein [Candidatus Latescibacteria bacterium]|nr:VCBS repeat-containing protein [Candidatus Latescibacterota bacterium]